MFESTPQQKVRTARIQRDGAEAALTRARHEVDQARRRVAEHEQAAREGLLLGWLRTPAVRRHERLADEARQDLESSQREQADTQNLLAQREDALLEADEELQAHREQLTRDDEELDREQQREGRAVQNVRDAVEAGEMSAEEAYASDGLVRPEVHDREVRRLEAEDGLDDLGWSPADDGGYAEAAEEARQDQLAVVQLDRSIDAGERTHDEVYTPEGHIRQELIQDEPETAPAPEPDRGRDNTPQRDQRAAPAMEFDEPF